MVTVVSASVALREATQSVIMTFWQENYSFIREVYDTRYCKMVEWMDNVEMAIQKVCASKVYTSAEFKREKDNFHVSINFHFNLMKCKFIIVVTL